MAADRRRQIIFYGDSNTYGYDPADPYRQMFPYDARWTTIVSKNLKDHFQVLAEGMNGRTLPVPPYEQSYLIKLISLSEGDGIFSTMLGTNDILLTTHPDADIPIRKMEQYITFLKRHLDHSQILIIAPPLIGGGDIGDPLLEMVDVMDLDGRGCVRLEEAMDCLLNAISIMKDEVENEKARW